MATGSCKGGWEILLAGYEGGKDLRLVNSNQSLLELPLVVSKSLFSFPLTSGNSPARPAAAPAPPTRPPARRYHAALAVIADGFSSLCLNEDPGLTSLTK